MGKTKIQSVLLSRELFTKQQAIDWVKRHGFRYRKVDPTERYWRFRQFDPHKRAKKRIITFTQGIRAIVEI